MCQGLIEYASARGADTSSKIASTATGFKLTFKCFVRKLHDKGITVAAEERLVHLISKREYVRGSCSSEVKKCWKARNWILSVRT